MLKLFEGVNNMEGVKECDLLTSIKVDKNFNQPTLLRIFSEKLSSTSYKSNPPDSFF